MEYPLASYPGISQIVDCFGTTTLGVYPDTAIVRFLPQVNTPVANGNLVWQQGAQVVQWTNAHLDFTSIQGDQKNGWITSARIQDRRVWWRFTEINGVYNEREPGGDLISSREKTPQQLATLLLDAMGESGYDVSALPNNTDDRPFVNWVGANAAFELGRLCRERGCDVALQHSTNTVKIVQLGVGSSLPSTYVQSVDFGVDIGEVPEIFKVYTAPVLFQCKLKLEAYGYDTDGELKPIDDLSFKPTGGWEAYANPEKPLVESTDEDERALARDYVFKLYKVTNTASDDLVLPGYDDPDIGGTYTGNGDTITAIEQIYPLNTVLAETYTDAGSVLRRKPAYVEGVFKYNQEDQEIPGNTTANTRYRGAFQIIPEQGLVLFSDAVFKEGATTGEYEPAELYLVTSFNLRHPTNGQYYRHARTRNLGGTGTFAINRNDIVRVIYTSYTSATTIDTITDNLTTVNTACDNVISAYLPEFTSNSANQVKYMGIVAGDADGLNRQVGYRISGGEHGTGANTVVSQNSEPEVGVMRRREKFDAAKFFARQQEPDESANNFERDRRVR